MADWKAELAQKIEGLRDEDWTSSAIPKIRYAWLFIDDVPLGDDELQLLVGSVNSEEFCGVQSGMLMVGSADIGGICFILRKSIAWETIRDADSRTTPPRVINFDSIPTLATPAELLARGELRIGERVVVDVEGPGRYEIQRMEHINAKHNGQYLVSKTSGRSGRVSWLHQSGKWVLPVEVGCTTIDTVRHAIFPGFFPDLDTALEHLHVATLAGPAVAAS